MTILYYTRIILPSTFPNVTHGVPILDTSIYNSEQHVEIHQHPFSSALRLV
jgi:hypothetical protein